MRNALTVVSLIPRLKVLWVRRPQPPLACMCREELNRPENKGLKPVVDKLRSIKDKIDEGSKKYGEGLPRHLA